MAMKSDRSILDPRIRRYVTPARIVWQTDGPAAPKNSERLLQPGAGLCVMKHDGADPGILLDFGKELHGGVQIDNGQTGDHAPVKVRIRFGESVSEAMGEPNNDHAIHNHICTIPWYGTAEIGNTGFRFVRIDLIDPGRELQLKSVRAVFLYRQLEYKGFFRCSDERLNRIWNTGAYTVHLCMQDHLWDGIKRDRLVWIGDMHPETMVVNTVFGKVDVVPDSLDVVRDRTPLPGWMNGISSYSLWWVLIQHCWYQYHGDLPYLMAQRDYLTELLARLRELVGEDNREALTGHRFLDWPSSGDDTAIHAGLQSLLAMALDAGAELCSVLGEIEEKEASVAAAGRLRQHLPEATPSKQANALMALAGLSDAAKTNADVLAVNQLSGISTFYGYYVLQARALAGDYEGCLQVIRKYWGAMLDLGATTFWEDFDLGWMEGSAGIDGLVPEGMKDIHADFGNYCYKGLRHSLCHGWASGPTAWMTEHVLGFRPLEPGSTRLLIDPHLGDLTFADGAFPTPAGLVTVRHKKLADGTVSTEIDAPKGIEVVRKTG
jgi:alpha-L-rhamnosidase